MSLWMSVVSLRDGLPCLKYLCQPSCVSVPVADRLFIKGEYLSFSPDYLTID